jgi:translocation and assembly module TamB
MPPDAFTPRPRFRSLRVARAAGLIVAWTVTGVFALVVAALLVIDLPWGRRLAVKELNAVLASDFKGRIVVESVGSLGLGGVGGANARVEAPDGTVVLVARGVGARIAPLAIVKSFLGHGDLRIDVFDIDVESLEANVDADKNGDLKVQAAFAPAQPPPPNPPPPGRGLLLEFPHVTLRHGWVHGTPAGATKVDADLDGLEAAIRVPPKGMTIDLTQVQLLTRGLRVGGTGVGADVLGRVEAHLAMPSKSGASLGVDGAFDGDVGGIATRVRGSMDGEAIDAVLDVFDAAAERVKALVPSLALEHPASAHIEARGPLSALAVSLHAGSGQARIDAGGRVAAKGNIAAALHVDVRRIDLHALVPTGPVSDLNAAIDLDVAQAYTGLYGGNYSVAVAPSTVGENRVPAAVLQGRFDQRTDGAYADLKTSLIELPAVLGRGHASMEASGTVVTAGPTTFDAKAQIALEKLDGFGVKLNAGHLDAHASGTPAAPHVEAAFEGKDVRAGGYEFQRAMASAEGDLSQVNVTAALFSDRASSFKVQAGVDLSKGVEVAPADVDVWKGTSAMHAHVEHVATVPGGVDVDGLVVTGVGSPLRASVHLRPGALAVKADTNGVDLGKIGGLLGLEAILRRGTAAFVIDLAARPAGVAGTAVLDMNDGCFWRIDGLTGHFDTRMQGREITAAVQMKAEGVGSIDADHLRLQLAGAGPLQEASWRKAWGDLHLKAEFDLARVIAFLPPNAVPFAGATGHVAIEGSVNRKEGADALPDVTMSLKTTKLRLAARGGQDEQHGPIVIVAPPQMPKSTLDVAMNVEADGPHGTAKINARLIDSHGVLVRIDAGSDAVPYAALASAGAALNDKLLHMPVTMKIAMADRPLDQMPDAIRVDGTKGTANVTLTLDGAAMAPRLEIHGAARNVQLVGSHDQTPFDADLAVTYDGVAGDVTLGAHAGGKELLHATARTNAKIDAMLGGHTDAWDASASARLSGFPLAAVPVLADRRVRGTASGDVELTGLHRDARAKMQLAVDDLRVGKQNYGTVRTRFDYDGTSGHAGLVVDQPAQPSLAAGSASADADIALKWGADVAPSLDPAGTTRAVLKAGSVRIGFLAPFLQAVLDSLDGRVDADAHVTLAPGQKPEMNGMVTLNDGVVGLPQLGQELNHVKARVVLTPDGTVRLQDASASGTSGKLTVAGTAHLDGTALTGAQVDLQIAKRDALPLDLEGTDVGSIYGKVSVKMDTSADRRAVTVAVDVPALHVQLPDETPHAVEDLDDPPASDHVGFYASPERFVKLPLDSHEAGAAPVPSGNSLSVKVHLGDIQIARGTDVRIGLGGDLVANVNTDTTVTGKITTHQGKLDVQGKSFDIESGTVTFAGDPGNPEVNVTAGWTAEDGTRVYADYLGPIKTGKVTLRSEPARPQNEIVALILFGTADGSESTPYQQPDSQLGAAGQAGTTVGGFATGGLSKGLDKLTGMDITAKIDTSQANPRPEVEMQVARNISLELAVVLGAIPPGTNPDTTYATVDWRFHKNWSLAATFGDMGSTIADVVWRRRY